MLSRLSHRTFVPRLIAGLVSCTIALFPLASLAQQQPPAASSSSSSSGQGAVDVGDAPEKNNPNSTSLPRRQLDRPPALVDPNGPAVSLQTSAALFYVAAGLNACGYDDELEGSDPIRLHVREQMRVALEATETARTPAMASAPTLPSTASPAAAETWPSTFPSLSISHLHPNSA